MEPMDFAWLYPCNVSEAAKTEQREFLYEAVALLSRCEEKKGQSDEADEDEEMAAQQIMSDTEPASSPYSIWIFGIVTCTAISERYGRSCDIRYVGESFSLLNKEHRRRRRPPTRRADQIARI